MNWDAYWGLAIVEADKQRALEERRALASALDYELAKLAENLSAGLEGLAPEVARLDLSVFESNRFKSWSLLPENASMVGHVYKLALELNSRCNAPASAIDARHSRRLTEQVAAALEKVRATLDGLAGTSSR
jgi:hypothetical protein